MHSAGDDMWPGRWPDFTMTSAARVWNALASGKDNFAVDRDVVRSVADIAPQFRDLTAANRRFVQHACEYLAGTAGITQFLDCGPGLPIGRHVHDFVHAIDPAARVLYVDHDPMALTHARALLATNDNVQVIDGDIFDPEQLLKQPDVLDSLDWSAPIAVLHTATLHHPPGFPRDVVDVMQAYVEALPPGSYTVISHLLDPEHPALTELIHQVEKRLVASMGSGWFRTQDEIRALFSGQDLIAPGIVACSNWPDPANPPEGIRGCLAGGIGRTPSSPTATQTLESAE